MWGMRTISCIAGCNAVGSGLITHEIRFYGDVESDDNIFSLYVYYLVYYINSILFIVFRVPIKGHL